MSYGTRIVVLRLISLLLIAAAVVGTGHAATPVFKFVKDGQTVLADQTSDAKAAPVSDPSIGGSWDDVTAISVTATLVGGWRGKRQSR